MDIKHGSRFDRNAMRGAEPAYKSFYKNKYLLVKGYGGN